MELCKTQSNLSFTYCINNIDCAKTEDNESCQNFVEENLNNPEICEYQLNYGEKTSCYKRLAIKFETPALCLKIPSNKDNCIIEYALAKNNPDVCKLADGFCFIRYAREHNNVTFCERITDDYISECYVEFAKRWNDISLCEKAPVPDFRDTCIKVLEAKKS